MYCLKCEKNNIHPRSDGGDRIASNVEEELDLLFFKSESPNGGTRTVQNGMTDNGDISIISMGYGSILDGDMYIIGVCDDCLKSLKENGLVIYYGNYMSLYMEKEEIEKSKKIYIRRRNLDDLIKD